MSFVNLFLKRGISTSCARYGKRNFRKFPIYNKRGSKQLKEERRNNPLCDFPADTRGVRDVGYYDQDGNFILIPEKVPEIVVPDLKDFPLKPYVSYRTPEVIQSALTAEDLFNVVYAPKILKDFTEGKLAEDGMPLEPSAEEKITAEEARIKAQQTGTDIF